MGDARPRFCTVGSLVGCVLLAAACGGLGDRSPPRVEGAFYTVIWVTDGDTFHILDHGKDERVRLIGIDTPEVDWYGGQGECFGTQAGLYTRTRLTGRRIRLAFDVDRYDRYGRLLAYAYLGSELFNRTLVREGYAEADPVPPDTRMAAGFARAESQAKARGVGLWRSCPGG